MVQGITRPNRPVESNDYSRCDIGRAAIVLGALFAPAAVHAGEHCSVDDDFMRNCGFSSMEQCKATVSGVCSSTSTTACWAFRPGRQAYCSGGRSASKIDSSTRRVLPQSIPQERETINCNSYAYAALSSHCAHIGRAAATKANK